MKICISGSQKFAKDILEAKDKLSAMGFECLLPVIGLKPEDLTPEKVSQLVFNHFEKIKESDIVLVVNPGGYFGNSVKTEIGFAKGAGKKVVFLESTGQPELDCLADRIIPISELAKIIEV